MGINIVVDVESDGPCPGLYSMISLAAVVVEPGFGRWFRTCMAPVSEKWNPEALAISGISRETHLTFNHPNEGMDDFHEWLTKLRGPDDTRLTMWSDNPAYDWQFVNYYFHHFTDSNPFGWSARRIGDLYCGTKNDLTAKWKHLRQTKHTHDPLDDARGNAEALLAITRHMKI